MKTILFNRSTLNSLEDYLSSVGIVFETKEEDNKSLILVTTKQKVENEMYRINNLLDELDMYGGGMLDFFNVLKQITRKTSVDDRDLLVYFV